MKKKKVLHIITRFIPGGADENTLFAIRALDQSRYSVDLMVGGESDFELISVIDDNINIIMMKELVRDISPFKDLLALFKIMKSLKENEYDIVNTHTAKAGILGRIAAKLAKTPVVIHTIHGITFHDYLNPVVKNLFIFAERIAGIFTDIFITVGDEIKNIYINKKIGEAVNYYTIRSGMHLDKFIQARNDAKSINKKLKAELGISNGDVIIGTASRLETRKGLIYLLRAATELTKNYPNTQFLIAGDGVKKYIYQDEVERLNLLHKVRFLGFRDDIHDLMSLFDIFVLTSLWEGLPRVLVQAATIGKPIVTFDIEGASEVVKNGVNGFIVPVKDISELVDKIAYLIENRDQANMMGERGRSIVGDSWDAKIMMDNISELYNKITNAG